MTATVAPARPTTTTEPETSPTVTGDASPTTADVDPELAAEIEEIEQDTVAVRELELLEPVGIAVITRDQLRENLIADLEEEYSQAEADQDTRELWLLRLIEDPDLDLYAFQLDLLTEQVLGYYDPEQDELFVVSDADGISPLAEFTLAHELVHTIQDQHYDIEQVRFYDQGDADRDTAAVAVLEGDAELAQIEYAGGMSPERLLELLAEAATRPRSSTARRRTCARVCIFPTRRASNSSRWRTTTAATTQSTRSTPTRPPRPSRSSIPRSTSTSATIRRRLSCPTSRRRSARAGPNWTVTRSASST
jgi:Zn-dependent peptidase ImmA (M78 family)